MIQQPARPGGERAATSADQRTKDLGTQLVCRLSAMIRVGRSYQPENQVFVGQLEQFLALLAPLLEENGEAVLVALDSDLYLNGARIPVRTNNVRFHEHVTGEFRVRWIAGFRVLQGLQIAELQEFFRLFLSGDHTGAGLLKACLGRGIDHILPAVHASTDCPEDGFEYDLSLPSDGEDPAGPSWKDTTSAVSLDPGGAGGGASAAYAAPRGAVRKSYSLAVQGARSLLTTTTLQGGIELRHAKRVVQPLVDGAYAAEPVVVGLSTLSHHDDFTYAHAVNVCLVAVTMGHFLEMDRRALADLGVAALLHDVGKSAVAAKIEHPLDAFTDQDRAWAERHPIEGVKLLARSTTLNATTLRCMRVALEHHIGPEHAGYPDLGGEWRTSVLSRLVAVADCYVSLQTHRSARGVHVTPYQSLGMMLGPLRTRFHSAMLWALVRTVGFYPPGQLVELDDGTVAVVLAPNADDLERPHLRVVITAQGERLAPEKASELRPLPPDRSIRRALRGEEYPPDPGLEKVA